MWKKIYNKGLHSVILNLRERQNKSKITNENLIMGISLVPSLATIESVPYLIKMDYENSVDIVADFTDYIVINVTERDK
jgi:hypothetical protein